MSLWVLPPLARWLFPACQRKLVLLGFGQMADWFKFYEDFFDNPRFQYAVHQLTEVCPVTVLLLTEHCRHKSATIPWTGDEVDLLGFSAKINVSPAKVNEAINLLVKIRYIELSNGTLKFIKWNDLQSDYCRRVERKCANKVQKSPEKSDFVRLEERRGEEIRIEESRKEGKEVASLPRFQKPTLEMVKLQGAKIGLPDPESEKFLNYYESNGWRVGRNSMKSWTHALNNWKNNGTNYQNNKGSGFNRDAKPVVPVKGSSPVGGF